MGTRLPHLLGLTLKPGDDYRPLLTTAGQEDLVDTHYTHLVDSRGTLNSGLSFEREITLISLAMNFSF